MLQMGYRRELMTNIFINWLPRAVETFKYFARVFGLSA